MTQTTTQRSWLDRLWGGIADQGRLFARVPAGDVKGPERARQLAVALLSERGEASGAAVARELLECLRALSDADRLAVLHSIGEGFAPDPARVQAAASAYLAEPSAEAANRLHTAAEPPRQELLRRMNMASGGTAMLVRLRHEMLPHLRAEPALRLLDHDLLHLFSSWFNRGFLELRRIDWDTPAAILEKLITYEAVHEIDGWQDLRRRLLPDRRCFAFFHQALPNEPLIFVEVALTAGLADAVQPLLAPPADGAGQPPKDAQTRLYFYSISNCQEGLARRQLRQFPDQAGGRGTARRAAQTPPVRDACRPCRGFRAWLDRQLAGEAPPLTDEEADRSWVLSPGQSAGRYCSAAALDGSWWDDAGRARKRCMRAADAPRSPPT